MRTEENFGREWKHLEWMLRFHNPRSYWFVPTADDYIISCIKPERKELPLGTAACQYRLINDEPCVISKVFASDVTKTEIAT